MTLPPPQPLSPFPNTPDSSPSHYIVEQMTPTAITAAFPIVVTIPDNDLENGQYLRATKFITTPLASATGMEQLNNKQFIVQQISGDTFHLYGPDNLPVDGRNFTPYIQGGQFTRTGQSLGIINPTEPPPPGNPPWPWEV